jgi:hypothetical protein
MPSHPIGMIKGGGARTNPPVNQPANSPVNPLANSPAIYPTNIMTYPPNDHLSLLNLESPSRPNGKGLEVINTKEATFELPFESKPGLKTIKKVDNEAES